MIKAALFENVLDIDIKLKINKHINSNIQNAFLMARDMLSDLGLSINEILDDHNFDLNEEQLNEYFYTAFDIVFSESFRDKIKPIYQYFIYQIIEWFIEVTVDLSEHMEPLDKDLVQSIKNYYDSMESEHISEYIIELLSDFTQYNEMIFDDFDFLSPMVEDMVQIYIKSPLFFRTVLADINLIDYVPLMPKDIKEQFLDFQSKSVNVQDSKSDKLNIKKLTRDIIRICEMIQSKPYMREWIEDQHNDTIRDGLELKDYIVRDQTRIGKSASGIQSGEADVQVFYNGTPCSVIESIVLCSLEKKKIEEHIKKIFGYDKRGNFANYFLSFIKVKDFSDYWEKYRQYIIDFEYDNDIFKKDFFEIDSNHGSELKCAVSVLDRSGQQTFLFHITVHL